MVRHREGQARDDHVGKRLARHIHTGPEAVGAEQHAVGVLAELLDHPVPRHALALHQQRQPFS
jgi:hypothetical protein